MMKINGSSISPLDWQVIPFENTYAAHARARVYAKPVGTVPYSLVALQTDWILIGYVLK